jgi:hypothetical protein
MIPHRWRRLSASVMSARQYVVFALLCSREIRGLRMSFAVSVRTSVKPVLQSADNTNMWRLCGNVPRPAPAVLRRAGRLPKLDPFEKLHRTQN